MEQQQREIDNLTKTATPSVDVSVKSFIDLFEMSPFPLAVDTYQRGFVWNDDKVRQLIEDLNAFEKEEKPQPAYYMGTILIHRNTEKKMFFIIDGQQRLTALCILHQQLTNALPRNCALTYSQKSVQRIRDAAEVVENHKTRPREDIFTKIVFTLIRVDRVDLAFTFFDTQNNRGVPLHATDLLKAYHLRAIDEEVNDRKEELQTLCARRWEGIQQGSPVMSHVQEFAPSLFTKFLWRSRYWTGQRIVYGGHDELMEEFQKHTWKPKSDSGTIALYRSRHNRLGTALTLNRDGHSEIHTNRISLSPQAVDLPFAIRQPIEKGIGFFLYADKYASLLRRLMVEAAVSSEIERFREVYEKLMMANSLYLREIFLLASLMYFDQFEDERLFAFALWLEHAFGAIRLDKQQVRYETAQNFFKFDNAHKEKMNLLDVIASSYRSDQVIDYLEHTHTHANSYGKEQKELGKDVRGAYKKAVLEYYNRAGEESLRDKPKWIADKLNGGAA